MSTVISVENMGKKYTISHQQNVDNSSLREVITNSITSFGKRILTPFTPHPSSFTGLKEDFWALKDVSFEVKQGDRIGIIGRNGAGKSTLLKILSRITEPTTGRVRIKGRVASLLEVGTGFHPELTGRENIYLNGAILGMGKQEIQRKFDEIVAFAEIEKFLDTPVKRYSSGMYVRLAFAVAAHLEPEILIVDEVLAVGDAQFQKKCLGKMEDVGREGRTVLFVSHNLSAVRDLCSRALVLDRGEGVLDDAVDSAIERYQTLSNSEENKTASWVNKELDAVGADVVINKVTVLGRDGRPMANFSNEESVRLEIKYTLLRELVGVRVVFYLLSRSGQIVLSGTNYRDGTASSSPGQYRCVVEIPRRTLNLGEYAVSLRIDIPKVRVIVEQKEYVIFAISDLIFNQMGICGLGEPKGLFHLDLLWQTETCS